MEELERVTYIKKYGRQLLEKYWCVRGSPITLSISMTPLLANAFLAGNLLHLLVCKSDCM